MSTAQELEQELGPLLASLGEYVEMREMAGGHMEVGGFTVDRLIELLTNQCDRLSKDLQRIRGESDGDFQEYMRSRFS